MDKQFYADDFYKDERGTIYTGEYIEHNGYIKERYELTKIKCPYEEIQGKTVRCNYSQIFGLDSNLILCNNIPEVDKYMECGEDDAVDQSDNEIFQWYLIDDSTAERLKRSTNELIFYSNKLDVYVLGVTHFGTGWDYVDTEFVY